MSWWKRLFGIEDKVVDPEPAADIKVEVGTSAYEVLIDPPEFPEIIKPAAEDAIVPESILDATMVQTGNYSEHKMIDVKPLNLMKVRFEAAENQSRRRDKVRGICLHHIMMGSFRKNVDFLKSKEAGVSAHYCLGKNAELVQMVNTTKKAWHAGVSEYEIGGSYRGNLNNCLIGIEIVNPGVVWKARNGKFIYNCGGKNLEWKGEVEPVKTSILYPSGKELEGYYVPYPQKQLEKLVALCKAIVEKYPDITRNDIVTHYQIAQPEGRKNDPFGLDLEYVRDSIFGGNNNGVV